MVPHPDLSQHEADQLARLTIETYAALPKHGKPIIRNNGVPEWTVLASITLSLPRQEPTELSATARSTATTDGEGKQFQIVSLASGVKVLPVVRLPPLGDTLHDSHAEILARRGFKRWLIDEATRVARGLRDAAEIQEGSESSPEDSHVRSTNHFDSSSEWLEWAPQEQTFKLQNGVQVWMYISTLPCGDASTLHTAALQAVQDPEMAALKNREPSSTATVTSVGINLEPGVMQDTVVATASAARGRNGYSSFGQIRTKPGRPDSPPSASFSCSDKIAAWSVLGLGGALLDGLLQPVYLDGLVIGGVEEEEGMLSQLEVGKEVKRALYGRLGILEGNIPAPYALHRSSVSFTSVPYPWHKTVVSAAHPGGSEPLTSNTSILLLPRTRPPYSDRGIATRAEVLVNGHKQVGSWKSPGMTLLPDKARSEVCKLELFRACTALLDLVCQQRESPRQKVKADESYHALKHRQGSVYQSVKALLRGAPDPEAVKPGVFLTLHGLSVTRGAVHDLTPPFAGWLVSGKPWESFSVNGQSVHALDHVKQL